MLPNWLLGKSKSKLQEILGGGGGGTDYTAGDGIDISNGVISFDPATTPAIDPSKVDGLDDDLAALAPKTALSNPNILHNPWFQINQRGVTSVTVSDEFIADRWRVCSNSEFAATRNSDGSIVIDNSSGDQGTVLYQKRTTTYLTSLLGNKLTASVLLSDGTIYSGTITYDGSSKNYVDNEYIHLYSPSNVTNQILGLEIKPGASVTIKALKLELGEISTLAMDIAPDMAIELAKCQRYFQTINADGGATIVAFGPARGTTTVQFVVDMPSEFRTRPTIDYQNIMVSKSADAAAVTFSDLELTHITRNHILFTANVTGSIAGTIYHLIINALGYINFDAEL